MPRILTACVLFVVGFAGALGYIHIKRQAAQPQTSGDAWQQNFDRAPRSSRRSSTFAGSALDSPVQLVPSDPGQGRATHEAILALSGDAASASPAACVAAIDTLARERPMQAVSVLQQHLHSASVPERHLALTTMRSMVARLDASDRDTQEGIRTAMRNVVQSAQDSAFAEEARQALSEFEHRFPDPDPENPDPTAAEAADDAR